MRQFFNRFKKRYVEHIVLSSHHKNVLIFEGITSIETNKKIKDDNHLLIVNGKCLMLNVDYGYNQNSFIIDKELKYGDNIIIVWLK